MKIKFLITLLLMSSVVNSIALSDTDFINTSFEKTEYTEVNPLIFDIWW